MGSGTSKKKEDDPSNNTRTNTDCNKEGTNDQNYQEHAQSQEKVENVEPTSNNPKDERFSQSIVSNEAREDERFSQSIVSTEAREDERFSQSIVSNEAREDERFSQSIVSNEAREDERFSQSIVSNEGRDRIQKEICKLLTFGTVDSDDENENQAEDKRPKTTKKGKSIYQPDFTVFPSHVTLREENLKYAACSNITAAEDEPFPTTQLKDDLFKVSDYTELDNYAMQAPQDLLHKPVEDVVQYLIKGRTTDLEKVRVLFIWFCCQKLSELPEVSSEDSIVYRLNAIHNVTEEHAVLYKDMCRVAEVKCELIYGWVKDSEYESGNVMEFVDNELTSWNAVQIDNNWRLINVNFASRGIDSGHGNWELIDDNGQLDTAQEGISYFIDEFHFLTDPELLIYSHLPEEEKWQLLARPVTKLEFQDMVQPGPVFFAAGMNVKEAKRALFETDSGETMIKLGMPKDIPRRFMYRLWKCSDEENTSVLQTTNVELNNLVYMQQASGLLTLKTTFPLPGRYKVQLFVNKNSDDSTEGAFSRAVEYVIINTQENSNFGGFPPNNRHEWGPGQDIEKMGLTPISHTRGRIETSDGTVDMTFHYISKVELSATLRDVNDEEIKNSVIYRIGNDEISIHIRLQNKGTYALDLYVGHSSEEESSAKLFHVCTYLIIATDGVFDKILFPSCDFKKPGLTTAGEKYPLQLLSHKHSYFKSEEGQEDIEIEFDGELYFLIKQEYHSIQASKELDGYTFYEHSRGRIIVNVRFPFSGMYLVKIFAKKGNSEGSYTNVFNYIVYAIRPMKDCRPFPKTFSAWGEDCRISGLDQLFLTSNEEIEVKAYVPNASSVAVVRESDNEWQKLTGNENSEWTGNVNSGDPGSELRLYGNFAEDGNHYNALLCCEVKTDEEIIQMEEEQAHELELCLEQREEERLFQSDKEKQFLLLKKELQMAINSMDTEKLRKTVKDTEEKSYTIKLRKEYNKARNLINALEKIAKLHELILKLDPKVMTQMRQHETPGKEIHEVLKATFLLLGISENKTKDWKFCQQKHDDAQIRSMIKNIKPEKIKLENAKRAIEILQPYRVDGVSRIDLGAACFYAWVIGISRISLQIGNL